MHPGGEILELSRRYSSKDLKEIFIEVSPEHGEFVLPLIKAVIHKGHFELSGGAHSPVYAQTAPLFSYVSIRAKLAAALLAEAGEAFPVGFTTTVIAMAQGATVLGVELARALSAKFLYMEPCGGEMHLHRGQILKATDKVLLLDNVVTMGGTLGKAEREIQERFGSVILGRVALIDRRRNLDDSLVSLVRLIAPVYAPPECPLCKREVPFTGHDAVKELKW